MMKSTITKQINKFENEASRRLYRGAADATRKLEQRLAVTSSIVELFSSEITDLRMRLKDYCERLIFTDPVEYGKKAEDLLWRKVYYDFFFRCKQNKKKLLESEQYQKEFVSHLLAGIGFYHHLLLRIQTEFHIDLEGKVDAPFLWHLRGVKKERWKKYQQSAANEENIHNWASQATHRILIYLGDLERYIAELNEIESNHLAERYYQQAFCLNSDNGTPHNQLGSLYNNRFESAYHYMRCLSCHDKFEGAEGNLQRVFERNEEVMKQLYSSECIDNGSLKDTKFLSRFLKLCQIFYFKTNESFGSEIYCQEILKEFDITLGNNYLENSFTKENSTCFITDDVTFKVAVMSLSCVHRLQEKSHVDASVATAFCLALFSYIVNQATKRLIGSVIELKPEGVKLSNPLDNQSNCIEKIDVSKESPLNESKEKVESKDLILTKSVENEEAKDLVLKKSKRKGPKKIVPCRLRNLRRRRKVSSTSQEDSELSEGEVLDLPESDDDTALLNSDVSETGSLSSDSMSENELLEEENEFDSDGDNENESKATDLKENVINVENNYNLSNGISNEMDAKETSFIKETVKTLSSQVHSILDDSSVSPDKIVCALKKNGLMPCLKVFCDWLRINEDILSACAESSQSFLTRLIELLNILTKIESKLASHIEQLSRFKPFSATCSQITPLPEDMNLKGFPLLKEIHSSVNFDIIKRKELSSSLQVCLRIQCILLLGRCLMKSVETSVDFDAEKKKYFFNVYKKENKSNQDTPTKQKSNVGNTEGQRQNLMRSMAHLWLKAEVNDLESLVSNCSKPQLSPFLVADTSVLCSNLSALKQLVSTKRFIIIVPLIVIANLDQLKKISIGARESIRWLETELSKGCRYIRAQRQMEKITLLPMKYPKKKEKEAWDYFTILECCNYLVQQQANDKSVCPLVTLLVESTNNLPENAVALAQSIDVKIENLGVFLTKWRSSCKNPG